MTIGDLLFALGIDGSRLEQDVTKEAQKAGDAGAKTLTQRMSAGLKGAGMKALAGTFSGAAAAATAGAVQMEDAVARIRSETGASQQQAEEIAKSANRIAGDQQQSLASVTDVAIAVKKDMGLVGDQLDKVTEQTVKYARVTKQDGVGAVKALDDIGDAWSLTAQDIVTVQDKLLVSNQKWGGSITENQDALAKMAPQLKALGATVDDGISLLNLFAASGLDSSKAMAALNTAVAKLKPGQTLNDLIKQVSSIEDPTLRAKKAIELFGAKGGVSLANVLRPGINGLSDFAVSADDAAGAVDKSVDDLDSSLGAHLRKVLSQAKAALRGFGLGGSALTALASVITAASALGLKIPLGPFDNVGKRLGGAIVTGVGGAIRAGAGIVGDAVGGAIAAVQGNAKFQAASDVVGKAMGSTAGKAFAVGFAAAAIVELALKFEEIKGELDSQAKDLTAQTADWTAQATEAQMRAQLEAVQNAKMRIAGFIGSGPASPAIAFLVGGQIDQLNAQEKAIKDALNALPNRGAGRDMDKKLADAGRVAGQSLVAGVRDGAAAEAPRTAASIGDTLLQEMEHRGPRVAGSIGNTLAKEFTSHGKAWITSAHAVAMRAMGAVAQGITDARQKPLDAMSQLVDMLKHPLTPMGEVAKLFGQLIGGQLQKGLHSKDPAIRAQAQYTKQLIIDRLTELDHQTGPLGKKAAEEVRKGLKSKDPDVRAAAQRLADRLPEAIRNKTPAAGTAARNMGATAARNLKAGFGTPTVTLTIKSVFDERGGHRARGGPVKARTPYWVNENTPRSEMFVPTTPGHILTHADAMRAVMASASGVSQPSTDMSTEINIGTLTLQGVGSDVSPAAAQRFGEAVLREVAGGFRQGGARLGITTSVRP